MDISFHEFLVEQVAPDGVHQFVLAVSENCSGGRLAELLNIDVLYGINQLVHVRLGNYRKYT